MLFPGDLQQARGLGQADASSGYPVYTPDAAFLDPRQAHLYPHMHAAAGVYKYYPSLDMPPHAVLPHPAAAVPSHLMLCAGPGVLMRDIAGAQGLYLPSPRMPPPVRLSFDEHSHACSSQHGANDGANALPPCAAADLLETARTQSVPSQGRSNSGCNVVAARQNTGGADPSVAGPRHAAGGAPKHRTSGEHSRTGDDKPDGPAGTDAGARWLCFQGVGILPALPRDPLSRVIAFYSVQRHAAADNSIQFWTEVVHSFFAPDAFLRFLVPGEPPAPGGGAPLGMCTSLPAAAVPWLLQMCWMCKMVWRTFAPGGVSQEAMPGGRIALTLQGAVDEALFDGCSLQQHADHFVVFNTDMTIAFWSTAVLRHRHVVEVPDALPAAMGCPGTDAFRAASGLSHGYLRSWLRFIEMTNLMTHDALGPSHAAAMQPAGPPAWALGMAAAPVKMSAWSNAQRSSLDEHAALLGAHCARLPRPVMPAMLVKQLPAATTGLHPVTPAMPAPRVPPCSPGAGCAHRSQGWKRSWQDVGNEESVLGGSEGPLSSDRSTRQANAQSQQQQQQQQQQPAGGGALAALRQSRSHTPAVAAQRVALPAGHPQNSPWANYYKVLDPSEDLTGGILRSPQQSSKSSKPRATA